MNNSWSIDPDRQHHRVMPHGTPKAPVHHDARQEAIHWPSERHLIPAQCGHCGSRVVLSDTPTAGFSTTDLTCFACSRTVCELVADGTREARRGR